MRFYKFYLVCLYVCSLFAFGACQQDPNHIVTKKWKMANSNEEFTLELRADSSYIVIENQKKPQVGKWKLDNDNKTISFQQKDDVVNMNIETLSEEKFVLNNNGDEMVFIASN